jgi:hypothetical protein
MVFGCHDLVFHFTETKQNCYCIVTESIKITVNVYFAMNEWHWHAQINILPLFIEVVLW